MCSLIVIQNVSYANYPNTWLTEQNLIPNRKDEVKTAVDNYDRVKGALETLNGEWNKNVAAIRSGAKVTLSGIATAIVGVAATASSGGSYAPVALAAALTGIDAAGTVSDTLDQSKYLSAMSNLISAMDALEGEVSRAYQMRYLTQYSNYIGVAKDHLQVDYVWLNTSINVQSKDRGYYHKGETPTADGEHSFVVQQYYMHWQSDPGESPYLWNTIALPENYPCPGPCTNMYRTPYEAYNNGHEIVCGGSSDPTATEAVGCSNIYYTCDENYNGYYEAHKPRNCGLSYWLNTPHGWSKPNCPYKFRRCSPRSAYHETNTEGSNFYGRCIDYGPGTSEQVNQFVAPDPAPTPVPSSDITYDCGNHSGPSSDSSGHEAASCGVSGHYSCDGSDHTLQASCTSMDSNGQSCTVTSFYACQSHTHVYPAVDITCPGCNRTYRSNASSRTLFRHQERTCANSGWITIDGERRRVRCGKSFRRCTNGNSQCATGRAYCNDANGAW